MAKLVGMIANLTVKSLAGMAIGSKIHSVMMKTIGATGVLETVSATTTKVVDVVVTGGSAYAGAKMVDTMLDIANANGYPLTGKVPFREVIELYNGERYENGIKYSVPDYKKKGKKGIEYVVSGKEKEGENPE